jgi:glycosyltransferase involved in cell wall biosynthesis
MYFSIIIPTFNRAEFLKKSLETAINQDFEDFEIIVVDDAGTDNTLEVIQSFKSEKIRYIKHPINKERAAARNTGILNANGNFVYFHDSDDLLLPNHLSSAFRYINQNPETHFLVNGYKIHVGEKSIKKITGFSSNLNIEIIKGNFVSCKAFVKREVAVQYLFNETRELSGSEDYECWLRISCFYPLKGNDEITSILVQHKERSVQEPNPQKLIKRIEVFEQILYSNNTFTDNYKKYLSDFHSDNMSYLALHLAMMGEQKKSLNFLLKSLAASPLRLITTKRFYVILRFYLF